MQQMQSMFHKRATGGRCVGNKAGSGGGAKSLNSASQPGQHSNNNSLSTLSALSAPPLAPISCPGCLGSIKIEGRNPAQTGVTKVPYLISSNGPVPGV